MARRGRTGSKTRNKASITLTGFEELIVKFDGLGGDVKKVVTKALSQAAEKVQTDTKAAMENQYLPAHGQFSTGETKRSIADPKVEWSGTLAEVGIGFDKTKGGAGGFLITGTPKMKPNAKLEDIYVRKKYMSNVQKQMQEIVSEEIKKAMER